MSSTAHIFGKKVEKSQKEVRSERIYSLFSLTLPLDALAGVMVSSATEGALFSSAGLTGSEWKLGECAREACS